MLWFSEHAIYVHKIERLVNQMVYLLYCCYCKHSYFVEAAIVNSFDFIKACFSAEHYSI